jgi:hypothetical protein
MAITLDGTAGITTPGLTNTGSTTIVALTTTGNTILGDASTDTLNVGNGNLVTDASGNVGVGVTPSAWYTVGGYKSIEIARVGNGITSLNASDIQIRSNSYLNSSGTSTYANTGFAANYEQYNGGHFWYSAPSGTAGTAITFTTPMTLDASGNLLLGTTSQLGTGLLCLKYTGGAINNGLVTQPSVNQYYNPAVFRNFSGTDTGYIQVNAGGNLTIFGTTSDYRLKNNPQSMVGALAKVMQLNPCTYTWKSDGSDGQGFIAHELQAIIPDAVIGEKDAVDTEGNPKYQGVDTSFLVATLTAAIQEQQALITTLTDRITALENK